MNVKRIVSGLIGFPIVVVLMLLGNISIHVIDIAICLIGIMSMYEFINCFKKNNKAKPISWICYIACLFISIIHIVPNEYLQFIMAIFVPLMITALFLHVIISNLKVTIIDIAVTVLGICYIALFFAFVPLLFGINHGNFYIWYAIFAAWGTDVFAYAFGRRIGKHKFSQISPNKSIEGCIAGTLGAVIIILVYTLIINTYYGLNVNYVIIGIIGLILSLVGQVGDFSASSIKRYVGVKDFSNLIPGHGGMLDRFDSLLFISPFAFFLLMLL